MNAKTLIITLINYFVWLICGLIIIFIANEIGENLHIVPLIIQYVTIIFFILFVVFRLFQQWRTRTVDMGDNKILIVGSILMFGTSCIFGSVNSVPPGYIPMNYIEYLSSTITSLVLVVIILIAAYCLKKSAGAAPQPTEATNKLMLMTLISYIGWIIAAVGLIERVHSSFSFNSDMWLWNFAQVGLFILYALVVLNFLRKQRRAGTPIIHEKNLITVGGLLFTITPIVILLIASFIGYSTTYSLFLTATQLCFSGGGIGLLVYSFFVIKKINQHAGAVPLAVTSQPGEIRQKQEEDKARKQAEVVAQRKVDAEVKQRQKVEAETKQKAKDAARAKADEEKAKRKAEEEARKRAEAEEKLRRKAEQDAQKKAEYEAEIRRRAEAEAKAKAEVEAKQRAEEDAKMKKLQQLVKVSDRLSVARMAQLLEMPAEEVWKHVPDWAEKFNFRIAGEELVFNKENMDDFIASLDKEFRKWGKDGKV